MLTAPLPVPPAPLAIETPPPLAEAEDPALRDKEPPAPLLPTATLTSPAEPDSAFAPTQHQGTRRSARRGPRPTPNTPVTSDNHVTTQQVNNIPAASLVVFMFCQQRAVEADEAAAIETVAVVVTVALGCSPLTRLPTPNTPVTSAVTHALRKQAGVGCGVPKGEDEGRGDGGIAACEREGRRDGASRLSQCGIAG